MLVHAFDLAGARWGRSEFSQFLETEWDRDPGIMYAVTKLAVDYALSFYERQQKAYRKKEGAELTLNNFFKSRTYTAEILNARLPRDAVRGAKRILSAA